ncbi:MAG: hypothetical protein KDA37_15725 [Planctomycetales bacterium]|nr:hypothetical protein [Planctomycetales bacterium]
MRQRVAKLTAAAVLVAGVWNCLPQNAGVADAYGWEGQRAISYQDPNDLFYNYYVGPGPCGTAAQLYVSPLPVPESVGHTYNTYQPLYPHEFMYGHHRSYYTHYNGAGWTRTNVRYSTLGHNVKHLFFSLCR